MILKAILSNKAHPVYGQSAIPFPIPNSEYDQTVTLLETMDIGSPTAQDCRVDELTSPYPILNRLVAQSVNVDELDYLAKRLESFCSSETAQFQAMASKLCLSDIKDFINLTFCCQQATVITDFSDLERIGKDHSLTINGGSMSMEKFKQVDGLAVALDLIQSDAGVVTPYGVVYDNGMKLEPFYDGRHLPVYCYKPATMVIGVKSGPEGTATGYLYLPCPDRQLQRSLERAGTDSQGFQMEVITDDLPPQVSALVSPTRDSIDDINQLCRVIEPLSTAERKKLEAVVLMAQPKEADEIRQLAENLEQFDFVADVQTLEDYGRYMIQESGHFEYDENLEGFYDYRLFGEIHSREESGEFTELGYVSYHGVLALEELMRNDPSERHQQGPQMGGIIQ